MYYLSTQLSAFLSSPKRFSADILRQIYTSLRLLVRFWPQNFEMSEILLT